MAHNQGEFLLPIIDLSKAKTHRTELAAKIVSALENIGFLYIDNVQDVDYEKMFDACRWFFGATMENKESSPFKEME